MNKDKLLTPKEILLSFLVILPLFAVMAFCQFKFMMILFVVMLFFLITLIVFYKTSSDGINKE